MKFNMIKVYEWWIEGHPSLVRTGCDIGQTGDGGEWRKCFGVNGSPEAVTVR